VAAGATVFAAINVTLRGFAFAAFGAALQLWRLHAIDYHSFGEMLKLTTSRFNTSLK